jgi:hypothetical protein
MGGPAAAKGVCNPSPPKKTVGFCFTATSTALSDVRRIANLLPGTALREGEHRHSQANEQRWALGEQWPSVHLARAWKPFPLRVGSSGVNLPEGGLGPLLRSGC